jgi:hypothetical protein
MDHRIVVVCPSLSLNLGRCHAHRRVLGSITCGLIRLLACHSALRAPWLRQSVGATDLWPWRDSCTAHPFVCTLFGETGASCLVSSRYVHSLLRWRSCACGHDLCEAPLAWCPRDATPSVNPCGKIRHDFPNSHALLNPCLNPHTPVPHPPSHSHRCTYAGLRSPPTTCFSDKLDGVGAVDRDSVEL